MRMKRKMRKKKKMRKGVREKMVWILKTQMV